MSRLHRSPDPVVRTLSDEEAARVRRSGRAWTIAMVALSPVALLVWLSTFVMITAPAWTRTPDLWDFLLPVAGVAMAVLFPLMFWKTWQAIRWRARMKAGRPVHQLTGAFVRRRSQHEGRACPYVGHQRVELLRDAIAGDVTEGRRVVAEVIRQDPFSTPLVVAMRLPGSRARRQVG